MPDTVYGDSHAESLENGLILLSSATEFGRVWLYPENIVYKGWSYPMTGEGIHSMSSRYSEHSDMSRCYSFLYSRRWDNYQIATRKCHPADTYHIILLEESETVISQRKSTTYWTSIVVRPRYTGPEPRTLSVLHCSFLNRFEFLGKVFPAHIRFSVPT